MLDCGAAAARFLFQKKHSPELPEILWISHMHSDHIGQFGSLIQSLWLRARRAPLHVFAPQSIISTLQEWLEKCLLFPELLGFPIYWHGMRAGRKYRQGAFTLIPFATEHLDNLASYFAKHYPRTSFECYGAVIECNGERYVYSADLAHPRELRPAFKKPVRALFCELTHFPEKQLFEELAKLPLEEVWITHYPDHLVHKEAELQKIAKACKFKGRLHLTHDRYSQEI